MREYYREVAHEFLPGKKLRECSVPLWAVWPFAWLSSNLSRERPLFDPTLYALDTVSSNLDFSNARMRAWLSALGLQEHVADTYR